jgi:cation:H+ antiporter
MTIIVFYTISTNFWFETHQLTWLDGIVLILVYAGMIVNLMKHKKITKPDILPTTDQTVMRSVWFIMIASLAALMIGADIVVKNSMSIAKRLGMSQHWVGLTFTSIGTTLPELATALSAIRHKEF